jgi:hypothetical protein
MNPAWPLLVLLFQTTQAPPGRLTIANATIRQFEDGPAIYADQKFVPGETVFLALQVRGFQVSKEQKVRLTYRFDAVDAQEVRLVETNLGKLDTELSPQDKNWVPTLRFSFVIPPHAEAGACRILASVKDELGGGDVQTVVPFAVRGHSVQPSGTLTVRNFGFFRREEDANPLTVAAYHGGDSLWARFDITGFKTGEKNRVSVESRISILNSEGKVVYTQPEAATEQDSPFYPKRYVAEVFSLNIQPGTPAGEYTILLSLSDLVGKQTSETRHPFRIE